MSVSYPKQRNKYPQFVKEGELEQRQQNIDSDTIYSRALIHQKVVLKIVHIGTTIKQTLEKAIAAQIEGKCIIEGYVKPKSVAVMTYSSGVINAADIVFEVVFECLVCSPVEGMVIRCIAKNITKAGIRAEMDENPSPLVIFIARDHHYKSNTFSNVKENDTIQVKVIGQRYELNDKYVSVIATLMSYESAVQVPLAIEEAVPVIINVPINVPSLTIPKKNVTVSTKPKKKLTIID